ncbi:MAG TPA: PQQ-binding-like beta-propeller repeat protein [Solirubrobacteraceae bacterium]|nr:PQQ-binding-like beta-propeller repeat protein [Solirubrobacteraceae bacterium]
MKGVAAAIAACALLAAVAAPAWADWPMYGHDLANSRDAGSDGPSPVQAQTLTPYWSFQSTDGHFTGTPAVSGNTVVVGSTGGMVDALDATTGRLLWSRAVGQQVNGSAAISGGVVYVPVNIVEATGSGQPEVVALDLATGSPRWQTTIDDQPGSDVYGSPVVSDGVVYIGTSASYAEEHLPAVHDRGSVVALDAATGAMKWKTYTVPVGDDGGAVWSTPAIEPATGLLYVGTGNAYHPPVAGATDAILALDLSTGAIVASFQATAGDVYQGGTGLDADIGASPNLFTSASGQALVGAGDKQGDYWALDRRTLALVWKANVGPGGIIGGILGSTAWDGSALYGPVTEHTETWSLTAGGAARWTTTDGGSVHLAPVSVANGVVYSTDNQADLTARSSADGSLLARVPLADPSWAGVAISGGTVFTAAGTQGATGYVQAFRPNCVQDPSGAREQGLVSGPVHGVGALLTSAGQPALGSLVHGLNCSLIVANGL